MTMHVPGEPGGGGCAQMRRVLRACARTPNPPCACAHPVLLQAMFKRAESFNKSISGWQAESVEVDGMRVRAIAINYVESHRPYAHTFDPKHLPCIKSGHMYMRTAGGRGGRELLK